MFSLCPSSSFSGPLHPLLPPSHFSQQTLGPCSPQVAVGDSVLLWEVGILAQDSAQQLVTLRGLCVALDLIQVSISLSLDQMSEKVPSYLGQGHFLRNPGRGGDSGSPAIFLPWSRYPPQSSPPLNSKGSLSSCLLGVFLDLSYCRKSGSNFPFLKSAVSGPNGTSFCLVPIIFSILHNLKLVQGVCVS